MVALFFFLCTEMQIPPQEIAGPHAKKAHAFMKNQTWFSGNVLIASQGTVILHQGYGWADRKQTVPMQTDLLFGIASISKQFTASALLLLAEKGKLSLQDPLSKFFPQVPPDKAAITLHQLLTHTAGLANTYAADGIRDRQKALAALFKPPLRYQIGQKFGYTADAYVLAAIVVEVVAGMPFNQFLDDHFLKPANLSSTWHWGHADLKDSQRVAQPESWPKRRYLRTNYGFQGCTGMLSTTGDLYRWFQILMGDQLLKKASREVLHKPTAAFSRGKQGYGWFQEASKGGRPTLWTRGTEDMGFSASITYYPDEDTVVVITCNTPIGDQKPGAHRMNALLEPQLFP